MWSTLTRTQQRITLLAMSRFGGGFVRLLAAAWLTADEINAGKLGQAFEGYVAQYGPDSQPYKLVLKDECKEVA